MDSSVWWYVLIYWIRNPRWARDNWRKVLGLSEIVDIRVVATVGINATFNKKKWNLLKWWTSDKTLSQFDKIYQLIEDSPKYGAKTHWGEILPTDRRFSKLDITFSNQRWGLNALSFISSSKTYISKNVSLSWYWIASCYER